MYREIIVQTKMNWLRRIEMLSLYQKDGYMARWVSVSSILIFVHGVQRSMICYLNQLVLSLCWNSWLHLQIISVVAETLSNNEMSKGDKMKHNWFLPTYFAVCSSRFDLIWKYCVIIHCWLISSDLICALDSAKGSAWKMWYREPRPNEGLV